MTPRLRIAVLSIVVSITLGGAVSVAEEAGVPAKQLGELVRKAMDDPTAYRLLESLTVEVGPRLAGTEASTRATAWAEAKFKEAGLQNIHAEAFAMPAWERGVGAVRVVSPTPQTLSAAALGGSVATPAEGIEADIVLFRTYAALLAAAPGSLAGKIAVVTQRMAATPDGSGYGPANPIRRAGPSEAAKRGALLYLHRSLGTENHRFPHAGALNYAEGVARIPAAALSNPDADQLERLAARGPVKLRVVLTPTVKENAQSWNVVGEVPGREKPDEIVLIGAHLDSWDLGTGATDDGAGVAMVTAAAKMIAALPQRPRRTLRVVLFGAEEMDYSGPAYAKAHGGEADRIVVAGEADFGARSIFAVRLPQGAAATDVGRALRDALVPFGAYLDAAPAAGGGSDIAPLATMGVPVVSLRQDGSDYFDTHHTADDTLDKVDSTQLTQAAAVWAGFVYLAADSAVDFRALKTNAH